MRLLQSASPATCRGVVFQKDQTVSPFPQSISRRKEGTSASIRNTYNLSVFNSLRRVFAPTELEGGAPVPPNRVSAPIGANLAPKGPGIRLLHVDSRSSSIPENFR